MKYVIKIGAKKTYGFEWGYYNGRTYRDLNGRFVEDFCKIEKAKRYSKRKNAEKIANKLQQECANVDLCFIEEVEDNE